MDEVLKTNYPHLVLILIDGMGVNILKQHLDSNALLNKHYKRALNTVFPPTTVAATTALLSAKTPYETGFLGWTQYNKNANVTETLFLEEETITKTKVSNSLLKQLNYQSIIDKIKTKHPEMQVEKLAIKPLFNCDFETFSEQLNRALMNTFSQQSFTYLYYPLLDTLLHSVGTKDLKISQHLKDINNDYEKFIDEIADDVLVLTTADHGFVDVEIINLSYYPKLTKLLKRAPSIESRSMTFFVKSLYKRKFKTLFKKYFNEDFNLYSKKEVKRLKLFGKGKKHPLFESFLGDFLAVAKTNKAFSLKNDNGLKAQHGGGLLEEFLIPLIINK